MNLKFTALEIDFGDAFFIEDNKWNCLFDSGINDKIVDLLNKKNVSKINLAICSHNDEDHSKGFIELLKSKIDIDEIWLPGLWAPILRFVTEHINDEDTWYSNECRTDACENNIDQLDSLFDLKSEPMNLEEFEDKLYTISALYDYYNDFYFSKFWYYQIRVLETPYAINVWKNLKNIMEIATLAYKKGCLIRWFESDKTCVSNKIDYGFVSLNSKETCHVKKLNSSTSFLFALNLTTVNKYSLVFEYQKEDIPIIRFSADSDCTHQSTSPYSYNIIVTAPHHGSNANAKVYKTIKGDNIIWVRSDKITNQRPCSDFKKQNAKYCLACGIKIFREEVSFEYDNIKKQWTNTKGNKCSC